MSVTTEADLKNESFKDHIDGAIKDLSSLVIETVCGARDFNDDLRAEWRKALSALLEMREEIGNTD